MFTNSFEKKKKKIFEAYNECWCQRKTSWKLKHGKNENLSAFTVSMFAVHTTRFYSEVKDFAFIQW